MTQRLAMLRSMTPLTLLLCALGLLAAGAAATSPVERSPASNRDPQPAAASPSAGRDYTTFTVRGRVVWLEDALRRGLGVTTDPSAAETTVVVETADARLLPIIPDVRGRAFAVDERLRDIDLQLLVRRYTRAPLVQVIRVLRPKSDGLYEIDYWCDVCAIPMVILKPCECCQGPTRLRERRVEDAAGGG